MKKKKTMLLVVLLMAVGFAAVSTTLYINGTTKISANQDDFNVYYSDALVNGVQDLSVITDDTNITFTTTLETLGEKYVLDYDVTNGSKNYDAELVVECTEGNDYLTVTNEFDTTTNLEALKTRSGKLTLELKKSYAGDTDMDVTITCEIDANAIERDSLGEATPEIAKWIYTDLDSSGDISIGDLYSYENETFNVISQTDDSVTMLAQYNLGTDYKQTSTNNTVKYLGLLDDNSWEYTPGPKEIVVRDWFRNIATYLDSYESYFDTKGYSVSADLITLADLGKLDCIVPVDYYPDGAISDSTNRTCVNSKYKSWLINGQVTGTKSASSLSAGSIWYMLSNGALFANSAGNKYSIRPVITISKSDLESL